MPLSARSCEFLVFEPPMLPPIINTTLNLLAVWFVAISIFHLSHFETLLKQSCIVKVSQICYFLTGHLSRLQKLRQNLMFLHTK